MIINLVLSKVSLRVIHNIGHLTGKIYFLLNRNQKTTLKNNLIITKLFKNPRDLEAAVNRNISEIGKTFIESFAIWASPHSRVLSWIREIQGENCIKRAIVKGKGIIFLTPHLGCYEITSVYYGSKNPITILYRIARKPWMNEIIDIGRSKGLVKLAPTTNAGIKKLLYALNNNEAIGILPDQVADKGQGVWANFFGRKSYTMILAQRLAEKTGATVILAYAERLSDSSGFIIHCKEITNKDYHKAQDLNDNLEKIIRKIPLQYLWSYDKFRRLQKNK
ncbi:MAG: lipid A biosynthesis acyltransferase [Candidatus Pelagibacter sp.]|nr:lipid A biosynthesis acyltransferase [Pseudomonadota bacterium]NQW07563.1 lipid A biosynthesis acyltransferase [Candidatus Pelagibacter sp.]